MNIRILLFFIVICMAGALVSGAQPLAPVLDSTASEGKNPDKALEESGPYHTYINIFGDTNSTSVTQLESKSALPRGDGRIRNENGKVPSFLVYLFILAFLILAVTIIIDRDLLNKLFATVINISQLTGLYNEGRFGFSVLNFNLDFFFILSIAIIVLRVFYPMHPEYFGWICVFTMAAYFVKIVFTQLTAYLFFDRSFSVSHALYGLLFTRVAGLILLPLAFCAVYQTRFPMDFIISGAFKFLLILYAIWLIRLLLKMKLDGTGGIFYLLLYLCAVEIFPLLIILKNFLI